MNTYNLDKTLVYDVVRLDGKTPQKWIESQTIKPKVCFTGSLISNGKPVGTVIENGSMAYDAGTGFGMGIFNGSISFGTPWQVKWDEYLSGYIGIVQDGRVIPIDEYYPTIRNNSVMTGKHKRIAVGRSDTGDISVLITPYVCDIIDFAEEALRQGFVDVSNHDGGGSIFLYIGGKWVYSTSRVLYNMIVGYSKEDWDNLKNPTQTPELSTENTMMLRSTEKQTVYSITGKGESGRYISKNDECIIGSIEPNGMINIEYPTSNGYRKAFVKGLDKFSVNVTTHNQNDYDETPYPAPGYSSATVKTSGCGPVSMTIALDALGFNVSVMELVNLAVDGGARVSGGTNMHTLCSLCEKEYSIETRTSSNISDVIDAVKAGNAVIVNVGGNRPGYEGVFSTGGHYICVVSILSDGTLIVVDPGLYSGKYDGYYRSKYVYVKNSFLYTNTEVIDKDSENRSPQYYIISK